MVDYRGFVICLFLYIPGTLILGASVTAGLFVFHVTVVPLVFKYSETFRRSLIFANFVQWPPNTNFEDPASSGIKGARNICIQYDSKIDKCPVRIGIWHILPKSSYERMKQYFENDSNNEELDSKLNSELSKSDRPIMFYCHGNSNSRAASHRIELYKFFQQMDFHTVAFDYRGYGDSTNLKPTELGVVEDSLVVYEWLRTTIDKGDVRPPVFFWGHSLGTGISSHLVANLRELSVELLKSKIPLLPPNGLILEAPFNNVADEVANFPLSKLVEWLPYFDYAFIKPFRTNPQYAFKSDEHLTKDTSKSLPILILHAEDDAVVPFVVGLKLYKAILASRSPSDAPVILNAFKASESLGHKWVCRASELPAIVGDFVTAHR